MESLLPLIIAIVISAILSAKKKKKSGQSYPEEKTTLPESPWDDLIRELKRETKPSEPDRRPQAMSGEQGNEPVFDRQGPVLQPVSPAPVFSYDNDLTVEPIVDTPSFTYDEQAIAEAEQRLKLSGYPEASIAVAEPLQPVQPIQPVLPVSSETAGKGIFSGGFDARMAVIYAEVMKPKFKEY